jgi:Fe-S-cluster containining protein
MSHPLLAEYFAARTKIDEAAAAIAARRSAALHCAPGCAQCCIGGLSVLSVEAFAIQEHLDAHGLAAGGEGPADACVFLDDVGRCKIYAARPVVCRTQGLPIRMKRGEEPQADQQQKLQILPDVEVCDLNFVDAKPGPDDVLDGETLSALLGVVEQRFRAAAGLPQKMERIPLSALALEGDDD